MMRRHFFQLKKSMAYDRRHNSHIKFTDSSSHSASLGMQATKDTLHLIIKLRCQPKMRGSRRIVLRWRYHALDGDFTGWTYPDMFCQSNFVIDSTAFERKGQPSSRGTRRKCDGEVMKGSICTENNTCLYSTVQIDRFDTEACFALLLGK
jgi:hypothetical protein